MLHTKFRGNRPTCSGEEDFQMVFTICLHGGHLGHGTSLAIMPITHIQYLYCYTKKNIINSEIDCRSVKMFRCKQKLRFQKF